MSILDVRYYLQWYEWYEHPEISGLRGGEMTRRSDLSRVVKEYGQSQAAGAAKPTGYVTRANRMTHCLSYGK